MCMFLVIIIIIFRKFICFGRGMLPLVCSMVCISGNMAKIFLGQWSNLIYFPSQWKVCLFHKFAFLIKYGDRCKPHHMIFLFLIHGQFSKMVNLLKNRFFDISRCQVVERLLLLVCAPTGKSLSKTFTERESASSSIGRRRRSGRRSKNLKIWNFHRVDQWVCRTLNIGRKKLKSEKIGIFEKRH